MAMDIGRALRGPKARSWLGRIRRQGKLAAGGALAACLCALALSLWIAKPDPSSWAEAEPAARSVLAAAPAAARVAARGALRIGAWSWEREQASQSSSRSAQAMLARRDPAAGAAAEAGFWVWKAASAALAAWTLLLWGALGEAVRLRMIMLGMTSRSQRTPAVLRIARSILAHALPAAGILAAAIV